LLDRGNRAGTAATFRRIRLGRSYPEDASGLPVVVAITENSDRVVEPLCWQ
jgi:hypothetical protein